jgi:uncharacterized membrane protein (DUF373 family)
VSKAFARKLAVFAKSLMSSTACSLLVLLALSVVRVLVPKAASQRESLAHLIG